MDKKEEKAMITNIIKNTRVSQEEGKGEREKEARLEELRKQRRKREEAERARAEIMLRQHHSQDGKEGQVSSCLLYTSDAADE